MLEGGDGQRIDLREKDWGKKVTRLRVVLHEKLESVRRSGRKTGGGGVGRTYWATEEKKI